MIDQSDARDKNLSLSDKTPHKNNQDFSRPKVNEETAKKIVSNAVDNKITYQEVLDGIHWHSTTYKGPQDLKAEAKTALNNFAKALNRLERSNDGTYADSENKLVEAAKDNEAVRLVLIELAKPTPAWSQADIPTKASVTDGKSLKSIKDLSALFQSFPDQNKLWTIINNEKYRVTIEGGPNSVEASRVLQGLEDKICDGKDLSPSWQESMPILQRNEKLQASFERIKKAIKDTILDVTIRKGKNLAKEIPALFKSFPDQEKLVTIINHEKNKILLQGGSGSTPASQVLQNLEYKVRDGVNTNDYCQDTMITPIFQRNRILQTSLEHIINQLQSDPSYQSNYVNHELSETLGKDSNNSDIDISNKDDSNMQDIQTISRNKYVNTSLMDLDRDNEDYSSQTRPNNLDSSVNDSVDIIGNPMQAIQQTSVPQKQMFFLNYVPTNLGSMLDYGIAGTSTQSSKTYKAFQKMEQKIRASQAITELNANSILSDRINMTSNTKNNIQLDTTLSDQKRQKLMDRDPESLAKQCFFARISCHDDKNTLINAAKDQANKEGINWANLNEKQQNTYIKTVRKQKNEASWNNLSEREKNDLIQKAIKSQEAAKEKLKSKTDKYPPNTYLNHTKKYNHIMSDLQEATNKYDTIAASMSRPEQLNSNNQGQIEKQKIQNAKKYFMHTITSTPEFQNLASDGQKRAVLSQAEFDWTRMSDSDKMKYWKPQPHEVDYNNDTMNNLQLTSSHNITGISRVSEHQKRSNQNHNTMLLTLEDQQRAKKNFIDSLTETQLYKKLPKSEQQNVLVQETHNWQQMPDHEKSFWLPGGTHVPVFNPDRNPYNAHPSFNPIGLPTFAETSQLFTQNRTPMQIENPYLIKPTRYPAIEDGVKWGAISQLPHVNSWNLSKETDKARSKKISDRNTVSYKKRAPKAKIYQTLMLQGFNDLRYRFMDANTIEGQNKRKKAKEEIDNFFEAYKTNNPDIETNLNMSESDIKKYQADIKIKWAIHLENKQNRDTSNQ